MSFEPTNTHRRLTLLHWLTVPLVIAILGVGAYRTWGLQSATSNRMDIVVITAAGKSLLFLAYILITSHIAKRSYKPTVILVMAIIDSVLWIAALGLTAYSMVQIPATGTRNVLNWILIVLLAMTFLISLLIAYLSFRQRKEVKRAAESEVNLRPYESAYKA